MQVAIRLLLPCKSLLENGEVLNDNGVYFFRVGNKVPYAPDTVFLIVLFKDKSQTYARKRIKETTLRVRANEFKLDYSNDEFNDQGDIQTCFDPESDAKVCSLTSSLRTGLSFDDSHGMGKILLKSSARERSRSGISNR